MQYAIIRSGGKQYRVAPGDIVHVEKLDGEPGAELAFGDVLMTAADGDIRVGNPGLEGVRVTAQVLRQGKAKKVLIFKKKRRKNYRRRQGHRQHLTTVRVTAIETGATDHGS